MMADVNLLGISGSLRAGSFNTKLVQEAARLMDGARLTMGDIRMPLYDGDLEANEGVPEEALTLEGQIKAADAIVISSPEYNGNIPGGLKNALDWISRIDGKPMANKPLALISAAAGRTGGALGQYSARACLVAFGPDILQGPDVMIAGAHNAFDDDGRLNDPNSEKMLAAMMARLAAKLG
jgi:chromate reductase